MQELHDHDHGLGHDLETMIRRVADRRQMLRWLAAGGLAPTMLACGGGGDAGTTTTTTTTTTTPTSGSCSVIPGETAGP